MAKAKDKKLKYEETKSEEIKDEEVKVEEVEVEEVEEVEEVKTKEKSKDEDCSYLSTFCKDPKKLKSVCTQKMLVPFAPKDKCNTAFWCQGKEVKVTLTDGIVFVDKRDHVIIEEMEKQDFTKI